MGFVLTFLIVVYFFLPETRLRTLEDMDTIFLSAKSPFEVVKIAKHMPRHVTAKTMEDMLSGSNKEAMLHVEAA